MLGLTGRDTKFDQSRRDLARSIEIVKLNENCYWRVALSFFRHSLVEEALKLFLAVLFPAAM